MADLARVHELLSEPDARALAFDPLGGTTVEMPAALGVSATLVVDAPGPLDVVTADSHGPAVVAYEHARREGHGTAHVRLADDGSPMWLEIFDLTDDHGCLLAIIVPDDGSAQDEREATTLAPRRSSYRLSVTGVIEAIDDDFTAMLGWTSEEVVGESSMTLIHPDDHEAGIVAWVDLLERPGEMTRLRQRFKTAAGNWLWCESTDHNALDDPDDPHVLGELIDISREVAAEAALQRRETVLDRLYRSLPTGVLVLDTDGSVATVNDRWHELLGGDPTRTTDGLALLLDVVDDATELGDTLEQAITDGTDHDLEVDLGGAGPARHADLHLRPIREGDAHVGLLVTLDDTTDRRIAADRLADQMRRDVLTGALNRRGVEEFLVDRLARPFDDGERLTVLYLDLDGFKSVNDRRGHAVGDEILRSVAESIRTTLAPSDVVARIGGDEFLAILVDGASDPDRIVAMIRADVDTMRFGPAAGTDLGVSAGRSDRRPGDDFDSLIARADAAMYRDKRHSRRAGDRAAQPFGPVGTFGAGDAFGRVTRTGATSSQDVPSSSTT